MRISCLIAILITLSSTCFGQIQINHPLERSVFQRNKQNVSSINISGNFEGFLDRIEARLVPVNEGQGTPTNWSIVTDKPEGGSFIGVIQGLGGWYSLQIRGWLNGSIITQSTVSRVGIGEVFVIAGQSNAEGVLDYGAKPSVDDRVNSLNFRESENVSEYPYLGSFSHIESNSMIAPKGQGAWCWGELGDHLTRRLNVPILFLNAAYGGSSSDNWIKSANGIPSENFFHVPFKGGAPYSSLRISLQFYASYLGVRAILWCQGEDDSEISENSYYSNIKAIIERSRIDANKNLSWVISRTSLNHYATTAINPEIIKAQNRLVSSVSNVFEGPYTDSIQIPRLEGVHFKNFGGNNDGISDLAKAWNIKLNDDFFNKSIPGQASSFITLKADCQLSETASLSFNGTFASQRWSDNSTATTLSAQDGSYSVIARDFSGNYFFSNTINVKTLHPSTVPFITAKGNHNFCKGGSSELLTTDTHFSNFRWNTGEMGRQITVKSSGVYTVKGINSFNCLSAASNEIITLEMPLPPKPNIFLSDGPVLCEGNSITLFASGTGSSLWSTNETTGSITLTKPAEYTITLRMQDLNGCISPISDETKISIKPRPEQPSIAQIGIYTLVAEQNSGQLVDAYEWKKDGAFLNTRAASIKTTKSGVFTVSGIKNYPISAGQTLSCRSFGSKAFSFTTTAAGAYDDLLIVYPNPVPDGKVFIEAQEDFSDLALFVYDTKGILLYTKSLPSLTERRQVDLSFLGEGKYILRINNHEFSESKNIWIEK